MKRALVLSMLILVGGVLITVSAYQAPSGPSAAAMAAAKIEKVKDNLYVIRGSEADNMATFSGGNTAVFVTDAGVVLVDTKLAGWGPTILERIKSVTNKPVTTIINTHAHGDHTGSNEFFGATIDSVTHENTKANMAGMDPFKGDKARFLPRRTYKDKMTLGSGKDQVDLHYFGAGHTSGDTFVVFPAVRTIHVGDMFAWKALPFIDAASGGNILEHPKTLAKAMAAIKNVDTVITGHIPVATWNELKEYTEFNQEFVTWAQNQMKAGKTVDQAAAEYKIPARFRGYTITPNPQFVSVKNNVQAVYDKSK